MTRMLFILAAVCLATAATADIPDPDLCGAAMTNGGHIWVIPGEGGPALTQVYSNWIPGEIVDGTITVTLIDAYGNPIVYYPGEDIWLDGSGPTFAYCIGGTMASSETDPQGQTTIVGPLHAGGQITATQQAQVMIAGSTAPGLVVPLTINSPDVNGDLVVDLSDITFMVQAIGSYDWRLDFNNDGVVNLADIAVFVLGLNHPTCY